MKTQTKPIIFDNDNPPKVFDLMEQMREGGWCVVLKVLPREINWIIEGCRSEYSPCPDAFVGKNKWVCEVQWMGEEGYSPSRFAMGETPEEAVNKVWWEINE